MSLNIAHAEDAWLDATAFFKEWKEEFEKEWFEPLGMTMMQMLWDRMTPEQHQAMMQANPQAYAMVQQMLSPG